LNATDPRPKTAGRPLGLWTCAAIILAACIPVYWLGIGHAGLGATEGHRAIPAWEMLDTGDWWLPHLFERVYLRKPPGMAWAIAASSTILGRTEFAARAVSAAAATLSALVALTFARRWFGPRAGLAAGLAQALMPVWFVFARNAEIESLHTLACQIAMFVALDLIIRPAGFGVFRSLALAGAITAAGLIKGPAGAPALLGALVAGATALRAPRALARPALLCGLILAGALLAGAFATIKSRLDASGLVPVLQDPSEFAPSLARLPKILQLCPAALLQGLPVTGAAALALWPRTAMRDRERGAPLSVPDDAGLIARALALTFALSVVILMVSGVSNPRYALPALTPLAPLAGWAWVGRLGLFDGWRRRLATWTSLGRLWAWPAVALVLIPIYVFTFMEPRRLEVSGKEAGDALAEALPGECVLYADWLVEARPEVLHYARERAGQLGRRVRVRWIDFDSFAPAAGERSVLVVRTDAHGDERLRGCLAPFLDNWRTTHTGTVYKYAFVVVESLDGR